MNAYNTILNTDTNGKRVECVEWYRGMVVCIDDVTAIMYNVYIIIHVWRVKIV